MNQLDVSRLDELVTQAQNSPRLRSNYNLHPTLDDPLQRLAIAMEPDTLVLPHRHPHTCEVLFSLRGRFVVLAFDEVGEVTHRTVLGEDSRVVELAAGEWHAVLSLDAGGVIFEVKQGAYRPVSPEDVAPWAAGRDAASLNGWYVHARVGERLS